ncbi:MAG: hypothetical protein HY286_15060 [Planctomycetes bacterium]|nr:hypothetical protein [Planctomycetota bacterium]
MKFAFLTFVSLTTAFVTNTATAQNAPAAAGTATQRPAAPRPPDFRSLGNSAVHLLRAAQGKDGSYGGDAEATALALYGFTKCARQYRETDGPFITKAVEYLLSKRAPDGAFKGNNTLNATLAAAVALDALDKTKYAGIVADAIKSAETAAKKTAPAKASGAELFNYAMDAAPELIGRLPADITDASEFSLPAAGAAQEPADVAKIARKLVLITMAASRVPPQKPQEIPATPLPAWDPNAKVDLDVTIRSGIGFLVKRQSPDGSFGTPVTKDQLIGVTALVAQAIWGWPGERPAEVAAAASKATKVVAGAARPDGSIHGGGLENYTTSASVGALVASGNPEYRDLVARAKKYITDLQADEGEGVSPEHWSYGGTGYGDEERPDMSNTNFALEALRKAGVKSDDPAMQKALKFLERCQNRSESNTTEISRDGVTAVSGNDGGGIYYPGKSQAGADKSADGKRETPRSYGSMTYALVKGFIFAGLQKDDPRLKAAFEWCKKNYTLDRVPGYEEMSKVSPRIAYQGLFYYYLTMATALRAYGEDEIITPDGQKHAWRVEMTSRLASLQKPDGSFANENSPRWWEGDEIIATAYAVLTLEALKK